MREDRLELLEPKLSRILESYSTDEQKAVAFAAARYAVFQARLVDPAVASALETMDHSLRAEIGRRVELLDEKYFSLEEAGASEKVVDEAFKRARAANSLFFALSPDPLEAATEALYEAHAVTGDVEAISSLVAEGKAS